MSERPAYVDEHSVTVPAGLEAAHAAIRSCAGDLTTAPTGPLGRAFTRLVETDPAAGFAVAVDDPPHRLSLTGHHRFSRYELEFRVEPAAGGSTVTAVTFADFPGLRGACYRAVVIGTRVHVLAVRRMLADVRRRIE